MLSARERQVLCEIERRLSSEDPGLAALLAGDMSPRLTRCAHDVTVVSRRCWRRCARSCRRRARGWWPGCSPASCSRFVVRASRRGPLSSMAAPRRRRVVRVGCNSGWLRIRDQCLRREMCGRRERQRDHG
jgi:hypothetical protein